MSNPPSETFGEKLKRITNNCGQATGLCCFRVKEQSQIALLENKIATRQRQFGVDYINLVQNKASQDELKQCLKDAMAEINELKRKINEHYDNIEEKETEVNEKIIPAADGASSVDNQPTKNAGKANERTSTPGRQSNNKAPSAPNKADTKPSGNNEKSAPKNRRGPPSKAAATGTKSPVKTKSTPSVEDVPEAYRDADPSKWKLKELKFQGAAMYDKKGKEEVITGQPVQDAISRFKANPGKYTALLYQTSMVTEKWPASNHKYTLIHREGTENYQPQGVSPSGWMTILLQEYERLPPFPGNVLPKENRDKYTDNMTFQGRKLHAGKNKPLMPGRGMGVGDTPLLKVIGDVDPSDISQGQVGDCWLLSGISSLAEFDGAIKKLFRKTKNLDKMPLDGPNMYTVTLWDLTTWKEVDVHIDERLACSPDGKGLLASRPSEDGELWVPYLEKAIAMHCGGWDKIVGGQCTHAWALMTGCKEQYTIQLNPKTGKYTCAAKYNPYEKKWAKHANSPHDGETGMWQCAWPKVGGGGDANLELNQNELFQRMVAWDKQNYIVGAGTKGTSDKHSTGGLVDNHAYSVIEACSNVAGTGVDILKVRNPKLSFYMLDKANSTL